MIAAAGKAASAQVAGREPTTDLAVLRLSDNLSEPAQVTMSDAVRVGQLVLALGRGDDGAAANPARTAADKGYVAIVPEDCCSTMNVDWHRASINYALTNVAAVTAADDVIRALD